MNTLSQKIRELRTEKGLSQTQLAAAIGLARSAIANYEQGIREPSIDILIMFCDFFEVSADYLIGRTDSY